MTETPTTPRRRARQQQNAPDRHLYTATPFQLELPEPADRVDVVVLTTAFENLGNNSAHLHLPNTFTVDQAIDGTIAQIQQAVTPTALPLPGRMKIYPKDDLEYYKLDEFGNETPFGTGGGCIHEEFMPAPAATSVTLSQVPQSISAIARDGMIQSEADGHYSLGGQTVNFSDPFTGAERVVVEYALQMRTGGPPPYNGGGIADGSITTDKLVDPITQEMIATPGILPPVGWMRLYPKGDGEYYKLDAAGNEMPFAIGGGCIREEFLPGAGETEVILSQAPVSISAIARAGVVQSEADGNFTWAPGADTITFGDAFTGTERVVIEYALHNPTPVPPNYIDNSSLKDPYTQPTIATPAPPPAGQMRLYPKADGLYYKLDENGVEALLGTSATGGWVPPPNPVTIIGSVDAVDSQVLEQLLAALASLGLIVNATTP